MAVDLAKKVAHLALDFRATVQLVQFIPYELEKRIVARLGLVKIEAPYGILGAYKNELKARAKTLKLSIEASGSRCVGRM